MTQPLTERLRGLKYTNIPYGSWREPERTVLINPDGPEAADRIDALEAMQAELVEALKKLELRLRPLADDDAEDDWRDKRKAHVMVTRILAKLESSQ